MAKQHVAIKVTLTATATSKPTESAYFAEGGLVIPRSNVIALQGKTIFYTSAIDLGEIKELDYNVEKQVQVYKTSNGAVLGLKPEELFVVQFDSAEGVDAADPADDDDGDREEAPKRRGRPPKAAAVEEAPKRRGRPPKNRDEAPVDIEEDEDDRPARGRRARDDDDEPAPARGRGRPARDDLDDDDEPAPRRGRPARNDDDGDDDEDARPARGRRARDEEDDEPAPRRGRASRDDDEQDDPGFDVSDDGDDDDRTGSASGDDDELDELF
jgi:hypothetical protein